MKLRQVTFVHNVSPPNCVGSKPTAILWGEHPECPVPPQQRCDVLTYDREDGTVYAVYVDGYGRRTHAYYVTGEGTRLVPYDDPAVSPVSQKPGHSWPEGGIMSRVCEAAGCGNQVPESRRACSRKCAGSLRRG
jgi:hypothetical protein